MELVEVQQVLNLSALQTIVAIALMNSSYREKESLVSLEGRKEKDLSVVILLPKFILFFSFSQQNSVSSSLLRA